MNYWVTKSGEKILIRDMTDKHLINTIKLLTRNGSDIIVYDGYDGDDKPYYDIEPNPIYEALVGEADKRGLNYE